MLRGTRHFTCSGVLPGANIVMWTLVAYTALPVIVPVPVILDDHLTPVTPGENVFPSHHGITCIIHDLTPRPTGHGNMTDLLGLLRHGNSEVTLCLTKCRVSAAQCFV